MNSFRYRATGVAAGLAGLMLAGCAQLPAWMTGAREVQVAEVRRLSVCNTASAQSQLTLLPDAAAVAAVDAERGTRLAAGAPLPPGPFLLAELGRRPTGGQSMLVARTAIAEGQTLTLSATFLTPVAGAATSQAESSPCVLVALPADSPPYQHIRLEDPSGRSRARWDASAMPAVAPTAPER